MHAYIYIYIYIYTYIHTYTLCMYNNFRPGPLQQVAPVPDGPQGHAAVLTGCTVCTDSHNTERERERGMNK